MVRKTKKGLEKILKIASAGVLALTSSLYGGVVVKSHPVQNKWRIGETYRLDILGNTTMLDVADRQINSANWWVSIPDYVTFQSSTLPDPINNPSQNTEDFFYNLLMNSPFNFIDNTVEGGGSAGWTQRLKQNSRVVQNVEGPSNVIDKSFGNYDFSVNNDAPIGTQSNFLMSGWIIGDTQGTQYRLTNGNLSMENHQFTYAPRRGDANGDNVIDTTDVQVFTDVLLGNDTDANHVYWADINDDGVTDGRDIQPFVDSYMANGQ